jgi:hypothetical protein
MQPFDWIDQTARALMLLAGVVMVLHFVAMAGYMKRGPRVRFVLLPVLVGAGAFLIGCAVVGSIDLGLIAMAFSSLPMLALLMVVWGSGGHVSEVFERQAQARDLERTRHYYREAAAGVDLVTDGLVTDSGLAELQAAEHRAHVGERAAA